MFVHFCEHLRELCVLKRCPLLWTFARVVRVMVLSTFVDTYASCLCYGFVHFCGHRSLSADNARQ